MSAIHLRTRGGTAAECDVANSVLRDREECIETDTGRRKVGDGVTPYNDLSYFHEPDVGRFFEEPCPTPTTDVTIYHFRGRDPVAWVFLETGTGILWDCGCAVVTPGQTVRINLDIALVGKVLLTF